MTKNRWQVRQVVPGRWGVFDNGSWQDVFDTLSEAHTYATQLAVADELFSPGGLTYLRALKEEFIGAQRDNSQAGVSSL